MFFHKYQNIGFRLFYLFPISIHHPVEKASNYYASPWWTFLCVVTLSQPPVNSHLSLIWSCDKGTETLKHVWHEAEVRCYIWGEVYKQLSIEPLFSPSQWPWEYDELPLLEYITSNCCDIGNTSLHSYLNPNVNKVTTEWDKKVVWIQKSFVLFRAT